MNLFLLCSIIGKAKYIEEDGAVIMSEEELKRIFASNIDYFINLSGKQQRDVAKEIGVAPTTFNTWCVGKILPTLPKLQKISEYFGVQVEDLITPLVGRKPVVRAKLSPEEERILQAYRAADEGIRDAVAKLLDVQRKKEDAIGSSVASGM